VITAKSGQSGDEAMRVDFLPVTIAPPVRAVGYYNDTQHRHTASTPLLRDEMVSGGGIDWASLVLLEDSRGGLAVVKESHKCVNQPGVQTGAFVIDANGVGVTGWGLPPSALRVDRYRWCWATWMVLYPTPDADARQLALKRFDRTRYPVRADLDLYAKANTWGSGGLPGVDSVRMAKESEVLPEIDSVADLGLDTLQIDDGWQVGRMKGNWAKDQEWQVRPDWYPQGWSHVLERAKERHIDLGIWFAARVPLDTLKSHYDRAPFKTWKLDFADLSQYDALESYLAKARDFITYTDHKVRVNWDATENAPRWGYFWARECGNIWLANRKPTMPESTIPVPHLQLREVRELSRYLNPSKFELAVQNYAKVDPDKSDAHLHNEIYSVAIALPGIPVFLQTTRLLTPTQRTDIKGVLDIYKSVRRQLFEAYVFEIGDEPDNNSWSGFQWVTPGSLEGHLLVFRERLNEQPERTIRLRFLKPGMQIQLTDLRSRATCTATLDAEGALPLTIERAGDISFLSYRIEPSAIDPKTPMR
jgi:hypothetical protein